MAKMTPATFALTLRAAKCKVEACEKPSRRWGWCDMHSKRWWAHGDPHYSLPTAEERFWRKVDKNGSPPESRPDLGSCWIWLASLQSGYGSFSIGMVDVLAHRAAYEFVKGPIPTGLTIDHLCRNKICVNPSHLEAVTMRVNTLRGTSLVANNARKTECSKGHPFDLLNTRYDKKGRRYCRHCARIRWHRNKGRRAA